ncbi:MAG: hypothetical protein IJ081_06070 [Prevotella sp.]|nr:hypothetical protein [Prevotella sp.]
MKKPILFLLALFCLLPLSARQLGIPYIRNYTAEEYDGHNRNFDIVVGKNGMVFVANFEGLLIYDQDEWRMLNTSSLSRITELFIDSKGVLWTGGYNYFGSLEIHPNGDVSLKGYEKTDSLQWEVTRIWERENKIYFETNKQSTYTIEGKHIKQLKTNPTEDAAIQTIDELMKEDATVTQVLTIENSLEVLATNNRGIIIRDMDGRTLCSVTEENGLCSNIVRRLSYNGYGILWGATDNGIFSISLPAAYTRFKSSEGLRDEVTDIRLVGNKMYAGTLSGLYLQSGQSFQPVEGVNFACWQIDEIKGRLLAATEDGIYLVDENAKATRFNANGAMSLLVEDDHFYSGEADGVYINYLSGERYRISDQQRVKRIIRDKHHTLWIQNIYGIIWYRKENEYAFSCLTHKNEHHEAATMVYMNGEVVVIDALATKPFPYPEFSYTDNSGMVWLTDNNGENLYVWNKGERFAQYDQLLNPLSSENFRCAYVDKQCAWLGSNDGIIVIDRSVVDPFSKNKPQLHFRTITVGDSVLWGGFGDCPTTLPELKSYENNLAFTFSLDYTTLQGQTTYRYRLNNGDWNVWNKRGFVHLNNQTYGYYTIQIQARDALGRLSDVVTLNYQIATPLYLKWYVILLYLIAIVVVVYAILRYRLHYLEKEKLRLEAVVNMRTAEVVAQKDEIIKQKDEIEEKSKSLEKALSDLGQAQSELIRQEKMATVGKLTQGLIDRILNPLNYINNFSKLSEGLVKDVEANITDEKDHMDDENYEDTMDVLNMLGSNLQKVSEHGQNTTRTLKAMEEMLKDRSGGMVKMDLAALLRQDHGMVLEYYKQQIAQYHINVVFDMPQETLFINGNADQLSKTIMSMLNNAVYAVVKKKEKGNTYQPEVSLKLFQDDQKATIEIRDNGTGINALTVQKIFDPFFTTKPTAEASGVGLYLSKEIIQNHGGDIVVESVKDEYTLFTITLPTL